MSDKVQFEEDNFSFTSPKKTSGGVQNNGTISTGYGHLQYDNNVPKGMAGWLIRHGLAKSGNTAQYILIGFVVFNITITFIVIKFLL